MLSFGIQFGAGFDQTTIIKVMQAVPVDFDYDLLVIGSNPGGVACAREARLADKKTGIITWKKYSPAEAEGYDEDLRDMERALGVSQVPPQVQSPTSEAALNSQNLKKSASELKSSMKKPQNAQSAQKPPTFRKNQSASQRSTQSGRRVRRSRLDLKNELFKRAQQCRRLMHNATVLGRIVEDARNCGWRLASVSSSPLTMNWHKMTEEIMDYVMEKNSDLMTMLNEERVDIIEGYPVLQNSHTIKLIKPDKSETDITADIICLAMPSECILPQDVQGAASYGITCDDFIRLELPPGNSLVVGGLPESLECAGILAGCHYPVTVVSRSKILNGYDSEISEMIITSLKDKGVKFMENTNLLSLELTENSKLRTKFGTPGKTVRKSGVEDSDLGVFDTVVFAVGRKVNFDIFSPQFSIDYDKETNKIFVNEKDATSVPNIYAVGDGLANRPEGFAIAELAGKLLGKRLFHDETELTDYSVIPNVILTPTEYAFVGISESAALNRLGKECVDVYYGSFKPLDFVIPAKEGICFAKVVVLKTNDAIIGVHIFGPQAGEIIQGFVAAIRSGLTMSKFQTVAGVNATKAQEILNLELKTYKTDVNAVTPET